MAGKPFHGRVERCHGPIAEEQIAEDGQQYEHTVASSPYQTISAASFEPVRLEAAIEAEANANAVSTRRFGPPMPNSSPTTEAVTPWTCCSRSSAAFERPFGRRSAVSLDGD